MLWLLLSTCLPVFKFSVVRFTGRMLTIGVIMAPVFHTWYKVLDKYVVGVGKKTVFKKIVADQILATPILYAAFFFGLYLHLYVWLLS